MLAPGYGLLMGIYCHIQEKKKCHYAYNTQRKIPVPGRTTQVTTDAQGRVVDFTIEEGKGDMKGNIIDVAKKWRSEHGVNPNFYL